MQGRLFMFPLLLVFLACHTPQVTCTKQLHHYMNTADLQRIFHVESHDKVPEYEVVRVRSRMRRSAQLDAPSVRAVHLRAFATTKVLNLVANPDLMRGGVPIYYADHDHHGQPVISEHQPPMFEQWGVPHQDEASMAAIMVAHDPLTGALTMDGTVGEDLVVRSLPSPYYDVLNQKENEQSINDLPPDDEFFMDDFEDIRDEMVFDNGLPINEFGTGSILEFNQRSAFKNKSMELPEGLSLLRRRRDADSEGFHVVYRSTVPFSDSDYAMMEPDQIPTRNPEARVRRKRSAPYIIYPEILVLVDYDGYLLHGQDNSQIKSYYVSFWNGVDLRYRLLKGPKVKVSIAGIIISRSRDAMPYLERNRVGRDAIDSASALTDMGKYLYQERRLPTYDIAVAITKYDLCRRRKSGRCTTGTAGFAYVGGACVVNKRLQKVNSVAIVEDTGGFSGIIVAAHEVGHLLGAVHDGSPPPSYLGGPGARKCRWEDGFIMSDLRHTDKGFRWSSCSTEQFHHFLNGDTATCLYNLPHEDESLPRVLPGKLLSLDAQCRKDRGTSACFRDDRVCAQLFCFDSSSGYCVSYRPAAEGSDCGGSNICRNGRCVQDTENSISDFDINRNGDHYQFESTQVKPVYTDPPSTTQPTTSATTTRKSNWWNRWDRNRWDQKTTKESTTLTTTPKTTTTTTTPTTTTTTQAPTTTKPKTTTTKPTTTTTTTTLSPLKDIKKPYKESLKSNDGNCEDRIANIAGSLTCREFLRSYGFRYCGHRYIQKNCCRSQSEMCQGQ